MLISMLHILWRRFFCLVTCMERLPYWYCTMHSFCRYSSVATCTSRLDPTDYDPNYDPTSTQLVTTLLVTCDGLTLLQAVCSAVIKCQSLSSEHLPESPEKCVYGRRSSCRGRPFQKTTISRAEMPVSISHNARKLSSSMSSDTSNVKISSASVITVSRILLLLRFAPSYLVYCLKNHKI